MPIPGALSMDAKHGIAKNYGFAFKGKIQNKKAYLLRNKILNIIINLKTIDDLEPNPKINRLFEELIHLIIPYQPDNILSLLMKDQYLLRNYSILHKICASAEYQLERHWANKIILSRNPKETLTQFPYYSNYVRLISKEVGLLRRLNKNRIERAVFVGSGPLPLTSILRELSG